jgi:hypothetical protein
MRGIDVTAIKKHADLLELVKSTPWETEQVMGYLKSQPETWVVLRDGTHPWYEIAKCGANSLLRHTLEVEQPVFLVNLKSRWLLILEDGELVPAIFLFTDEARDGIAVSFYRIFGGAAISPEWMKTMNGLIQVVLDMNPPFVPELETPSPYADMYRVRYG